MKPLALLLMLASAAFCQFGINHDGPLEFVALKSCGTVSPLQQGGFTESEPTCLWLTLKTVDESVDTYLITVTFNDAEGEHKFVWTSLQKEHEYESYIFDFDFGTWQLKTVEIEQFSGKQSVQWSRFNFR